MTDECRIILDEALTASDNGATMSERVNAHLGTCSECRRSLEAAKALSASVGSVLPTEDTAALKLKIAKKLEASMQARKAAALKAATTAAPAPLAIIGLGIAAAVTLGAYCLTSSSNSNQASVKNNQNSSGSSVVSASTDEVNKNLLPNTNQNSEVYNEIFSDGYNGDLRNFEKVKKPSESVPSVFKD